MSTKEFIEETRVFHYATQLPIQLYYRNDLIYSLPNHIITSNSIINSSNGSNVLIDTSLEPLIPHYIQNEYQECYIYFPTSESYYVIVGPFVTEPILEGHVQNIIRNKHLPIKLKSQLVNHYEKLPIIDSNRFYYCGKLLIAMYTSSDTLIGKAQEHDIDSNDIHSDYFINTLENRMKLFHHPPYFLEQEIIKKIKDCDTKNAKYILSEINALKRAVLSMDPIRSLKNSLICSCTLYTRAIIEGGVQPDAAFTLSDSFIMEIERTESFNALEKLEYKMLEGFIDMMKNLSQTKYSKVIQQTLEYVNNNLTEKLTLNKLSENVYVHPNYLSSLFKKEVGISLSQYILKKRIEEASYFIKYSNSSLIEIANFYQFCNQSYFIEVFKKFKGVTPQEYKRS